MNAPKSVPVPQDPPPGFVTTTSKGLPPSPFPGSTTSRRVESTKVTPQAPPIVTAHPFTKPDPRIVAVVPPAVLPTAGKIESVETPAP